MRVQMGIMSGLLALALAAQGPRTSPPRLLVEIPVSFGGFSAPQDQLSPHVQSGEARARANDLPGALADFTRAIADNPGDVIAYRERAGVEEAQRNLDAALSDLNRAVAQAPDNSDNYFYRAQFEWNAKHDQAAAAADIDRATALHNGKVAPYLIYTLRAENDLDLQDLHHPHTPTATEWRAALDDISHAISAAPRPQLTLLQTRAAIAADMGNLRVALADYDQVIALTRPRDGVGMSLNLQARGAVRKTAGDLPGALADFSAAIAIGGVQDADAYRERAAIRRTQGDLTGAWADEAAARGDAPLPVNILPSDATASEVAARDRSEAGDAAGAIAILTQAIASTPDRAVLYAERGHAEDLAGKNAEALTDYSESLALNGKELDARIARANLRYRRLDRAGALTDIGVAIDERPDDWRLLATRAEWEASQQINERAIADFDRALQLAPAQTPPATLADLRRSREQAAVTLSRQTKLAAPAEPVKITLRLAGPAIAGMPIWLYADGLGGDLAVRYPYYTYPFMIGSNHIELRRDGALVTERPLRGGGGFEMFGGRVLGSVAPPTAPQGRLPLHVLYDLAPGQYEVRWSVGGPDVLPGLRSAPPPQRTWAKSDWFKFSVAAPEPAKRAAWLQSLLASPPTDNGIMVGDYLPSLFAAIDDTRVQRAVMNAMYSPDKLVAAYARGMRAYIAARAQVELTIAMLRERGPSAVQDSLDPNLFLDHRTEIARAVLPYVSAPNDDQVAGALYFLSGIGNSLQPRDAATIAAVQRAVDAAAPGIIFRGGESATALANYLWQTPGDTARDLLWRIVDRGAGGTGQGLIAIARSQRASPRPSRRVRACR